MTTELVSWTPEVVYEPIMAAHKAALMATAAATKAVTPRRTGKLAGSVKAISTGELSGIVGTRLFYGKFVAGGAGAHEIAPKKRKKKRALAAPGFGPFARVHSPGTPATHFVQRGAMSYPEAFKLAAAAAFASRLRRR